MDLEASHRELTSATLCCLGSDTTNEVQIAGDATKWLLGLRDGRSLVLLVVCHCGSGVTPGIDDMGQAIVTINGRDTPEGLNDGSRRLMVRYLLKQWKANLVCLQETKFQNLSRGVIRSLWGGPYVDCLFVGSNGALGGVYGPHDLSARRNFWDEMSGVESWWDVPWVVGGDFNVVRYPSERLGAVNITTPMQKFMDFISSTRLMDISMAEGRYTWSNSNSRSRLDRFLFSPSVKEHFTMEGDWNTKYFHHIVNSHHRKSSIGNIVVDGETIADLMEINLRIVDFYRNLFAESGVRRPTLDALTVSASDGDDVVWLEKLSLRWRRTSCKSSTNSMTMCQHLKMLSSRGDSGTVVLVGIGEDRFSCVFQQAHFSVLVNGTPCGFFASSHGLRHGDPLSPLLFILVMEALSRLLSRARDGGFILGYDIAASGLKINLGKSELVPVGNVTNVMELAAVWGCKVAALPIIYLGLPLGSSFKDKTIWNCIIEKMEKRLAGWKLGVACRIEKIQRDFLWEGMDGEFKYHLCHVYRETIPSWPGLPVYKDPEDPLVAWVAISSGNTTPHGLTCCRFIGNKTPRGLLPCL
uniref:Endonuclease/exonuclease/phosphatase domain-containing protein n=1 Tax=Fagus sylvatica TaxID=28930 RepID=A0A2N9GTP0_FAGSY